MRNLFDMRNFAARVLSGALVLVALTLVPTLAAAESTEWLAYIFPDGDALGEPREDPPVTPILRDGDVAGYVFETVDYAPIPAYSGQPVNMRVAMTKEGRITGAQLLEHAEPIALVGVPEERLVAFLDQYVDKSIDERVRVGRSRRNRDEATAVDSVSGATTTVVVMGESVMRAARQVAVALALTDPGDVGPLQERAQVRGEHFETADWYALVEEGAIARLHLTRGDVDDAFAGTPAEGVGKAPEGAEGETFMDLYVAYLNVPTIGRNLLGESGYERLMARLDEDEHAIAAMATADSEYSFKGDGWVRGGIFDRFQVGQDGGFQPFRDRDLVRLYDVAIERAPALGEKEIFIVRSQAQLDPGRLMEIELLVRRSVGALERENARFGVDYQVPERFLDIPEPPAAVVAEERPLWLSIWEDRIVRIAVLVASLILLTAILFFQDLLARRPRLLNWLRTGFLIYTVVFIGWYALAQLSVVNVITFTHSVFGDFQWSTFLMDPLIFILWTFVAVTVLLWGRGIFCGWLCPFGAMQELIGKVAQAFRIPQWEFSFAVHERLWAVKYLVLFALVAVSLFSLERAEIYAEVEPFKTAVTMHFMREWGFVVYAVVLLAVSAINHKFYCRYVCPLGAALAIPGRLRLFDWLRRRPECGSPCQVCSNECEIRAIHPDGRIDQNECHHCLDCQVTYWNDRKCPPLVAKRKKREKAKRTASKEHRIIELKPVYSERR